LEEEYSDSGEEYSESEEETSETAMRPIPSLAGESVPGRIESPARRGLDRLSSVGEWEHDYHPSE
jgi:hypothetical protein